MFAILGDDEPVNRGTVFAEDDTEYNKHTIVVKSPIAQRVQFSLNRYHPKHYHGACADNMDVNTEVLV